MFGKIGDMANMLKKAQEMQGKMKEMQEKVAAARFDAESGGGAVTATVNGKMEVIGVKIDPQTIAGGDVEMIEDLVKAAFIAAQTKATEAMKQEVASMTGEMGLPPGLDKMLGGQG